MCENTVSPARSAAEDIARDILTRNGLSMAWSKWWDMVAPTTREAIFDEWEKIINRRMDGHV